MGLLITGRQPFQHFIVPEAQNSHAFSLQVCSPAGVLLGPLRVLAAIQLDRKCAFTAQEVADEWSDGYLPRELEAAKLTPA